MLLNADPVINIRNRAEHPEVLSYVPCFCGCERSGHRGNEDCFVKARDVNGDVVEWDEHGMECAVCLDVATRSQQMFTSGASLARHSGGRRKGIQAAVDEHDPDAGGAPQSLTPESVICHLVIWSIDWQIAVHIPQSMTQITR